MFGEAMLVDPEEVPDFVKGLIIMGTLRAVKQRQANAQMFIFQSKK
jgi:hypothetical protein